MLYISLTHCCGEWCVNLAARFRVYRTIVVLPSKYNKVSVACAGVPYKVPRDRPILLISAHPNVINRVFASECYEGVAKDEQERIHEGIRQRRSNHRIKSCMCCKLCCCVPDS
ncbi:uncharacterized protein LOC115233572 [Formica exsecta]|uniref:uncharacterized protein LOC115233572 n=1 Tax=Formica exsecta TaxID=72781 RepID=UPI001141DB85|nr:uncharacterized protein LOC115233572 [Formica exsecta]